MSNQYEVLGKAPTSDELKNLTVELPPKNQNADISCNAAMVLSKINKNNPIILAEILGIRIS